MADISSSGEFALFYAEATTIFICVPSVILTLFAGMLNVGSTIYGLVFLYAFFANAFFLVRLLAFRPPVANLMQYIPPQLRSLRSVVLPDALNSPANVGTVNPSQRKRRITFLFLEAVSQIVYMGVLIRV